MPNLRDTFIKIYANVPLGVRNEIIAVLNKQPMTWHVVYFEVKHNTKIGKKLLEYLRRLKII